MVCVGGPALTFWLQPTDEELFQRYNPELQKKSLERRYERQKDFDDFVTRLKEYSKSDKNCTEISPPYPPTPRDYATIWREMVDVD